MCEMLYMHGERYRALAIQASGAQRDLPSEHTETPEVMIGRDRRRAYRPMAGVSGPDKRHSDQEHPGDAHGEAGTQGCATSGARPECVKRHPDPLAARRQPARRLRQRVNE